MFGVEPDRELHNLHRWHDAFLQRRSDLESGSRRGDDDASNVPKSKSSLN